jgi:hypothetical protein
MAKLSDWELANLCYAANRAVSLVEDRTAAPASPPPEQIASLLRGIAFARANPGVTPEEQHSAWMADKASEGWMYGPDIRPERKAHPSMRPYSELPRGQQLKDYLVLALLAWSEDP